MLFLFFLVSDNRRRLCRGGRRRQRLTLGGHGVEPREPSAVGSTSPKRMVQIVPRGGIWCLDLARVAYAGNEGPARGRVEANQWSRV
ncbi:hypothetical protein V6N13_021852 [Hibiscus sabdariffa]